MKILIILFSISFFGFFPLENIEMSNDSNCSSAYLTRTSSECSMCSIRGNIVKVVNKRKDKRVTVYILEKESSQFGTLEKETEAYTLGPGESKKVGCEGGSVCEYQSIYYITGCEVL